MKKFIVNEDWETIEVEDTSSFFVLIFKQGTAVAGYIKAYSVDDTAVLAEYESLISQYDGVKFVDPASILVIKVPATSQVKAMLEEAEYAGDETNESKIEIINHLLGRADCEIIKEKVLMTLEEAKKKKKKKKKSSSKVTYLTGFPWLNDHRFNHAMGSCGCNKDENPGEDAADNVNDAIGGGESTSEGSGDGSLGRDAGSSESGAMGEALVTEAMTPLDKMKALENGTRGFNAAAASDQKLLDNYKICMSNGLAKALKVVVTEISARMNAGTWTLGTLPTITPPKLTNQPAALKKIDLTTFDFYSAGQHYLTSVEAAALKLYVESNDLSSLIKTLEDIHTSSYSTSEISLSYMFAMLVFALYMKYDDAIQALRDTIIKNYGFTAAEIKQYLKDKILSNSAVINKVQQAIKETLSEQKTKEQKNMALTEAKRYIKRYYIRPQNVFASNKAEILQRLAEVEADGANCSVYSLKALDDHDDVHLLQPKDIIYYYDEGVLYDKNHVPVLDYDLNVKNEEERPKISADATSDERFKDVYQDRMTDRTFAESLDDFYMDFDDVNVFGIKLQEGKEAEYTCCICGDDFEGYGNNPAPYKESGKCCDACNRKFVIPARLMQLQDEE